MRVITPIAIAALCLTSTIAQAGGLAPTITEQVIVVPEEADTSVSDLVVPLIFVALIAAAASSGGTSAGGGEGDRVIDGVN